MALSRTGRRNLLTLGLRLGLVGLLALLGLPLLVNDTPVSAQTANSVSVPATFIAPEQTATFSVTFAGDPGAAVTVAATLAGGTATGAAACTTSGTDYKSGGISATLTSGDTSHDIFAINICGDAAAEADETFVITWTASASVFDSSAANCDSGTVCTTTVTIVDEDTVFDLPGHWALKPDDVDPGEEFRLLFITSARVDATAPDMRVYNQFVQGLASNGHGDIQRLGLHFRAVGCTQAVDALTNANLGGTGVPIYYLNGGKMADDYADFLDGSWDTSSAGSGREETGDAVTTANPIVWSGCDDNGQTRSGHNYLGSPITLVTHSYPYTGQGGLDSGFSGLNSFSNPLYAISPVFRAADSFVESVYKQKPDSARVNAGSSASRIVGSDQVSLDLNVSQQNSSDRTLTYNWEYSTVWGKTAAGDHCRVIRGDIVAGGAITLPEDADGPYQTTVKAFKAWPAAGCVGSYDEHLYPSAIRFGGHKVVRIDTSYARNTFTDVTLSASTDTLLFARPASGGNPSHAVITANLWRPWLDAAVDIPVQFSYIINRPDRSGVTSAGFVRDYVEGFTHIRVDKYDVHGEAYVTLKEAPRFINPGTLRVSLDTSSMPSGMRAGTPSFVDLATRLLTSEGRASRAGEEQYSEQEFISYVEEFSQQQGSQGAPVGENPTPPTPPTPPPPTPPPPNSLAKPGLSVSDAEVREDASPQGQYLEFVISLDKPVQRFVFISMRTRDVTATVSGHDYYAHSGGLFFLPGDQRRTVRVYVPPSDGIPEGDETMQLVITSALGAPIADGTGTGTIVD